MTLSPGSYARSVSSLSLVALASIAATSLALACSSSSAPGGGDECDACAGSSASSGSSHGAGSSGGGEMDAGGGGTVGVDAAAFPASMSCYKMDSFGCGVITTIVAGECPTGYTQGLCPSASLIGCCVTTEPTSSNYGIAGAACTYTSQQNPTEAECLASGHDWTTQAL